MQAAGDFSSWERHSFAGTGYEGIGKWKRNVSGVRR